MINQRVRTAEGIGTVTGISANGTVHLITLDSGRKIFASRRDITFILG